MSRKDRTFTTDVAHLPDAFAAYQLAHRKPIRYSWWRRFLDGRAGVRDRYRPATEAPPAPVAETPWLQRLVAECHDSIARERTFTEAAVSVLDGELAMLRAEQEQLAEAEADLTGKLAASHGVALSDAPASAPERFCTPEEIVQRRSAEHASRVASLRGSLDAATNRRRDVGTRIALLEQERVNHWVLLKERARNLAGYHTRRAATYTRKLERRRAGVHFVAPTIEAPEWATAELGAVIHLPIAA